MLRVGLTGGIATGKSRVLRRLAEAGFHTLDLDRVAHEVMAPGGAAYAEVVEVFGPGVVGPDGQVDRRALGALVFEDEASRARLNAIVHPQVRAEEARRAAALAAEAGAVMVTDAALLVEAGVHLRFDRLVVVSCPEALQVRRLMDRDGLDERSAHARVAAQMPGEEKRRFGHYVLETSGTIDETDRAAAYLVTRLRALAASEPPRVSLDVDHAAASLLHGPATGPWGLQPARVVSAIAEDRGIEMERLARLLAPAVARPWYLAANDYREGPGPETLAVPLVLWSSGQRGLDREYLTAVSATVARLTHAEAGPVTGACLFGQVLLQAAATGRISDATGEAWEEWCAMASRWGGGAAPAWVAAVVDAAAIHSTDPAAATAAAGRRGVPEPSLAGALVGIVTGVPEAPAPRELTAAIEALLQQGRAGSEV